MALIVCFTGYIHWLEHMKCMFTQEQCLADDPVAGYVNFFDAFFIMMTTIAVIGYLSPVTSEAGKVSMIVVMAIVVVVIPNQSSKLVSLIRYSIFHNFITTFFQFKINICKKTL